MRTLATHVLTSRLGRWVLPCSTSESLRVLLGVPDDRDYRTLRSSDVAEGEVLRNESGFLICVLGHGERGVEAATYWHPGDGWQRGSLYDDGVYDLAERGRWALLRETDAGKAKRAGRAAAAPASLDEASRTALDAPENPTDPRTSSPS